MPLKSRIGMPYVIFSQFKTKSTTGYKVDERGLENNVKLQRMIFINFGLVVAVLMSRAVLLEKKLYLNTVKSSECIYQVCQRTLSTFLQVTINRTLDQF